MTAEKITEETLFNDLKTDEGKSNFFLSGQGYHTGVIALAIQNDVAMAYSRCAEYAKSLADSESKNDRFRSGVVEQLRLLAKRMETEKDERLLLVLSDALEAKE